MEIGSIESGKISIKILTTNEVSLTILTSDEMKDEVVYPGAAANRVSGEHGLALIITIEDGQQTKSILLDSGGLAGTIFENAKQLGVNLHEVDKLVLSHGHFDHYGSLPQLIPELKEGCEFYLSPNCFLQLYTAIKKNGQEIPPEELPVALKKQKDAFAISRKMPSLSKTLIDNLAKENGIKIIETSEPVNLHSGVITSGQIELFDEQEITKGFYIMKSRKEYEKHSFRDETSIYINIKDKGLVVITGCGHCGVINTIKHAQKLTGVDTLYAIIGGFHEEWNPAEVIETKVRFLEGLNPKITCGMHCTGFEFNKIMSRHPSHVIGVVGTEFKV